MKDKILPIVNIALSTIALIITIAFNIYFNNYGYKSPGTVFWILLEGGVLLINILILFYDFSYVHGISIFGAIAAIIICSQYMIFESTSIGTEYDNVYLFCIPHLIIYIIILIIEIIYFTRYVSKS